MSALSKVCHHSHCFGTTTAFHQTKKLLFLPSKSPRMIHDSELTGAAGGASSSDMFEILLENLCVVRGKLWWVQEFQDIWMR